MDRSTTKPLTGTFFYILLALTDRERYGLGIIQEIERRTHGEIRLGPGTLYNAMKKMLQEGLIEETVGKGDPREDDPRRRYYKITQAGRDTVEGEAARLERLVRAARLKHILPARRSS
jgi:DNA-binding PadR family transcriptional regulator